jgi:predicted nucleic acid-binding protein
VNDIPFAHDHLVLDTSVVIKWYRQGEVLAKQALVLREAYLSGEATVSVPSLLVYELANVLHYKNDLSAEQVQEAVRSLLALNLHIFPPDDLLMCQAVEIARSYRTTVYEATFAALAQVLPASFVTADEGLARRLGGLSFVHPLAEVGARHSGEDLGR